MATPADRALELLVQRQLQRRRFNERLAALDPGDDPLATTPFRCECGLVACGATIRLSASEYDDVRTDPHRFVMLAEHALPEADRVVDVHRGWAVVETLLPHALDTQPLRTRSA
jgi:hypothetical protein